MVEYFPSQRVPLQAYASRGYIAVAIDSRYHGERAINKTTYLDVLDPTLLSISYLITYFN